MEENWPLFCLLARKNEGLTFILYFLILGSEWYKLYPYIQIYKYKYIYVYIDAKYTVRNQMNCFISEFSSIFKTNLEKKSYCTIRLNIIYYMEYLNYTISPLSKLQITALLYISLFKV